LRQSPPHLLRTKLLKKSTLKICSGFPHVVDDFPPDDQSAMMKTLGNVGEKISKSKRSARASMLALGHSEKSRRAGRIWPKSSRILGDLYP
jgi:hypothetical protein